MAKIAPICCAILDVLAAGVRQDGIDRIWTTAEIADAAGELRRAVISASRRLVARNLVERQGRGRFRLTDAGLGAQSNPVSVFAPPRERLRKNPKRRATRTLFWRAIRQKSLEIITVGIVVRQVALPGQDTGSLKHHAAHYLCALATAGYLERLERLPSGKRGSQGVMRYRLVRNTGHLAPIIRKSDRVIYDPNTGDVFPLDKQGVGQ